MTIRSYEELSRLHTFEDRFEYLKMGGNVGKETFGFDRHLNQQFYTSHEWRQVRHEVIARDLGCDLGVSGYDIKHRVYIHHMNPITKRQLLHGDLSVLDPEYLITCTLRTHNAIHYGDASLVRLAPERRPGDTKLW